MEWTPNAQGHSLAGSVNAWYCSTCQRATWAIHVDAGVTPFMLGCRRTKGCTGMAKSMMYPDKPLDQRAVLIAWEWYKPTARQLRRMDAATRDHVERGGLVLRALSDAGRALIPEGVLS